jgi:sugar phosphate isomerase/epimerase
MQLIFEDGRSAHLGYCYNVLPGETVDALIDQVGRICGPVRAQLGVDRLGVGLWIARPAADELRGNPRRLRDLAGALDRDGLYCFTLNGFPYGGFHQPRVKERVLQPTWADSARLEYTVDLAAILAELLPEDIGTGSISTVPLGPVTTDRVAARHALNRAADVFDTIAERTGKRIELAVEPEPGACFERTTALVDFLDRRSGLGVCLDCCHAAVVDEEPAQAFAAMTAAGVRCAKIQISSALVALHPDRDAPQLAVLDEPRFLHQVRSARGAAMDLPSALATLDRDTPWRIHFHVPVHRAGIAGFETTQSTVSSVLAAAIATPGPLPHLEVETYTWSVLPADERADTDQDLIDGISRELSWAVEQLTALGARLS